MRGWMDKEGRGEVEESQRREEEWDEGEKYKVSEQKKNFYCPSYLRIPCL